MHRSFLLMLLSWLPSLALAAPISVTDFTCVGGQEQELLTLRNTGRRRAALRNWHVTNQRGDEFWFPRLQLRPGQSVTLNSGAGEQVLQGGHKEVFWSLDHEAWDDASDELRLFNARGKLVVSMNCGAVSNPTPHTPGGGKRVFFIRHSTGGIYWDGGMRAALESHGYEGDAPWWPGETDPDDFPGEFTKAETWEVLESYDIIIFKSCFPASDITSDQMLEDYKQWYRQLYGVYAAHPEKIFVPLSTPPLLRAHTSASAAQRAIAFEQWLLGEYKNNYSGGNLAPFRLHTLLDNEAGYLAAEFIEDPGDDHPNAHSGEVVGPAIVGHLDNL